MISLEEDGTSFLTQYRDVGDVLYPGIELMWYREKETGRLL